MQRLLQSFKVSRIRDACFKSFQSSKGSKGSKSSKGFSKHPSEERRYELLLSGYPKVNQDYVCLLLGERRHHTFRSCPLWAKKSPLIWVPKNKPRLCLFAFGRAEVRVAFNDRAERCHSRNLVTERDPSSKQYRSASL